MKVVRNIIKWFLIVLVFLWIIFLNFLYFLGKKLSFSKFGQDLISLAVRLDDPRPTQKEIVRFHRQVLGFYSAAINDYYLALVISQYAKLETIRKKVKKSSCSR